MIRIQVLAPFKYQYRNTGMWLTTGESIYLNPQSKTQREELKYILSSSFPYRASVYIDKSTLDESIKSELAEEWGCYSIDPPPPLPEEVCPLIPDSSLVPPREPEPNPHLHPVIGALVGESVETSLCEETEQSDIEDRKKELSLTNWSRVKDIANSYGIEYTNKAEVIEQIIEVEFHEPN